jgi:hypothetical protein
MSHPHVVQFVDAVRPWAEAYRNSTLSFVALAHENEFVIVAAALRLNTNAGRPLEAAFETTSLRAAEVPINGSTDAVLQFTKAALSGQPLVVGDYVLKFLKDPSVRADTPPTMTTLPLNTEHGTDRTSIVCD